MPTVKELNVQLENRPGTLAKLCNALANRKVNIIAFQASTEERRSQVHLVVDNLMTAKTVLAAEGLTYTEVDVARLHRVGCFAADSDGFVQVRQLPGDLEPEP